MNDDQLGGLFAVFFLFAVLFAAAAAGARRKDWPKAPPIGSGQSRHDEKRRGMRGLVLGWGYGLILTPLIILAVQPLAQERLALWHIALFSVLGVFTGSTLVWWMGGWPFGSDEQRKE